MIEKGKWILPTLFILLMTVTSALEVPSEITIFSGDTYNGEIIVKNTASTLGSFILSVSCNSSNVDVRGSELIFEAGEEAGLSFSTSGINTNKQDLIAECTYIVTDRKSGISNSNKGIVIVKYQSDLICEPSSVRCIDANILRTCSEDGTTYEDTKCKAGCQQLQDVDGVCKTEKESKAMISLSNLFLIIIFILLLFVLLKNLFKIKKKK